VLIRLTIFIGIVILFLPAAGMAGTEQLLKDLGGPQHAEAYELPYLPPYCKCKGAVNIDPQTKEKLRKKWDSFFRKYPYGENWIHLHHYCQGLLMLNRFYRGAGNPSALLKEAEAQFDYMIEHSNPKFILVPEYHLKMGITQKLMGKDGKAIEHFMKAIELKKDYVPAYMQLIDCYKDHDPENAIKTAEMGLKHSPNSEILKNKLGELQSLPATKE
jgi:tetratricopeptide (TPR) repeat protein